MHTVTILDLYHIFNAFAWESSWEIPVYTNVLFMQWEQFSSIRTRYQKLKKYFQKMACKFIS